MYLVCLVLLEKKKFCPVLHPMLNTDNALVTFAITKLNIILFIYYTGNVLPSPTRRSSDLSTISAEDAPCHATSVKYTSGKLASTVHRVCPGPVIAGPGHTRWTEIGRAHV